MSVKVFMPEMISAGLLIELPSNSQKQSRHEFAELRKSIKDNGFDESLLVRPVEAGYEIIAGNHRFRAGKAEGMEEFPCVIRNDWDDVKSEIESVRRNYVRGKIDKEAFTHQVDKLANDEGLPLDVIYSQMGFEDADAFSKFYSKEKEAQDEMARDVAENSTSAAAVRLLDDLGNVLSEILAKYGNTVPNSFIIFPAGKKHHLYVASSTALKQVMQAVAEQAVSQGIDINIALTGLLQIGMSQTNFLNGDGGVEVNEEGAKEVDVDPDISPIEENS